MSGNHHDHSKDDWSQFHPEADKGREPELIPGRLGRHLVSVQALLERIERLFFEENSEDTLLEADSQTKRLKLILSTVDYVLAVESIQLSKDEKARLIEKAFSSIFGYGPLDPLFLDERVTTISLDGPNKAAVRYGHGDMTPLGPLFQDEAHLKRILRRLLADAGAQLREDQPFIEAGLRIEGRSVCINLAGPPLNLNYSADIRLHPRVLPTPYKLVESGFMTEDAGRVLKGLAESNFGFVIIGDTEAGKTMLLSMLAHLLPQPEQSLSVERAGELFLPPGIARLVVRWPADNQPGQSFGEQISEALARRPACILLDEVRSDEPESIAPLLTMDEPPRLIWSFRGPVDVKRLRSALTMLARRANPAQGEALVNELYRRLPFMITVTRRDGRLRLHSLAEWQFHTSDYPDYVQLMRWEDGYLRRTGERPLRQINLPEDFWVPG